MCSGGGGCRDKDIQQAFAFMRAQEDLLANFQLQQDDKLVKQMALNQDALAKLLTHNREQLGLFFLEKNTWISMMPNAWTQGLRLWISSLTKLKLHLISDGVVCKITHEYLWLNGYGIAKRKHAAAVGLGLFQLQLSAAQLAQLLVVSGYDPAVGLGCAEIALT
jgi:hypothetical protein